VSDYWVFIYILVAPALYVLARLMSRAYFKEKYEYHQRLMREITKEECSSHD